MVQPMSPAPATTPAKKGGGAWLGCGGAGCGFALLLTLVGAVLLVFGMEPRTSEALPFAFVALGFASLAGMVGLVLLIVGFMKRRG
jgi:hypothetical protein